MEQDTRTTEERISCIADNFLRIMRKHFQFKVRTSIQETVYYDRNGTPSGRLIVRDVRLADRVFGPRQPLQRDNEDHREPSADLDGTSITE